MHENILAAVIGLDEPESFGRIEPLHTACRHVRTPFLNQRKQFRAGLARRQLDSDQSNCGRIKVFLIMKRTNVKSIPTQATSRVRADAKGGNKWTCFRRLNCRIG
jgi:hypothetical protein